MNPDQVAAEVTDAARAHLTARIEALDALTVALRKNLTPWQTHPVRLAEERLIAFHKPLIAAARAEILTRDQIRAAVSSYIQQHHPLHTEAKDTP